MNYADIVTPEEMQDAAQWLAPALAALRAPDAARPAAQTECRRNDCGVPATGSNVTGQTLFSFTCGGVPAATLLRDAELREALDRPRPGVTRHTFTRRDAATGVEAALEVLEYKDFPAVEWLVRLRNTGTRATPPIENLLGLDAVLPLSGRVVLHHTTGDFCFPESYAMHEDELAAGAEMTFAPVGGRPTNKAWPYYNFESPDAARGVLLAIGWAGQWAARFRRPTLTDGVKVCGGQQSLRVALRPGEEIRSSLSVVLFYRGDAVRAQNLWRRWMLAHNMPRLHGEPPAPFFGANWGVEMHQADEASQLAFLDRYAAAGLQLDYWWMDAGWYPCGGHWVPTGTWAVDRTRFPRGLRHIAEHAHRQGVKTLVWFEPERVYQDTELWREHPEWLLRDECQPQNRLLDLGNPEARQWLLERVCRLIDEEKIDLYRQDFNFDPLGFWQAGEEPDRIGMREMRHVEGYLAFWAELRKRYPNMLIDSCASGGRRNDLETLRLSVPLHKTDYDYADLPVKQAIHYSLYHWVPFIGAGVCPDENAVAFRTAMCPCMVTGFNMLDPKLDLAAVKRFVAEWRRIAPMFSGDYYPLTPYSRRKDQWIAWQFHRPDLKAGIVQAFRRPESPFESARFRLRGLDPAARYAVTDMDTPECRAEIAGAELADAGVAVAMPDAPQAKVLLYEEI